MCAVHNNLPGVATQLSAARRGRATTLFAKLLKQTTSNYFTKNLSVTVSQRHLSEEIFYDSLGIGIQIRGDPNPRGAKSALKLDLDYEKSLRHACPLRQVLRQGKALSRAGCLSRRLIAKKWARFNFCDSMHCDMGHDMHCDMGNPGRKLGVG